MSRFPSPRALLWLVLPLAVAGVAMLAIPNRFTAHLFGSKPPRDVAYLHHCRRTSQPPRPMLVVAKQGEPVTCPVCGTSVADGAPDPRAVRHWTENGYADVLVSPNKLTGLITAEASARSLRKMIRTSAAVVRHPGPEQPVWISARLTAAHAKLIRTGQGVFVDIPALREQLRGTVREIEPIADEQSRVLRIRVDLDDPERILVSINELDVRVSVDFGDRLSVPAGAVITAGPARMVFVDKGRGVFQPRDVALGIEADDFVEVLSGVSEGERVLSRGHFLVDAERRLTPALTGLAQEPQATP